MLNNLRTSDYLWVGIMPFYDFVCMKHRIIFTTRAPVGDLTIKAKCPFCKKLCPRTGFHPVPFVFKEKN